MRRFLLASAVALAAASISPFASAQTIKAVMHSDVKILDPVFSGAYITRNHAYMIYDTLLPWMRSCRSSRRWSTAGRPATTG
jgi:peptide/nickel transport system substrate-binding protein